LRGVIATIAFVVGFIVLGLTVLLVAMRAGGGGQPKRGERASRGGSPAGRRAATIALAALMLALLVVVPLLIVAGNSESKGRAAVGGVDLSEDEAKGRSVFARHCSMCHTLRGANAVGKVGPNLDVLRPPAALSLDAINKGRARGKGQMPAEVVDGEDARNVADFVAAVAGR
jgi:mono/diheme cytochrome c family protein